MHIPDTRLNFRKAAGGVAVVARARANSPTHHQLTDPPTTHPLGCQPTDPPANQPSGLPLNRPTQARVLELSAGRPGGCLASVTLLGIGRCQVVGIASGRGQAVTVRHCTPHALLTRTHALLTRTQALATNHPARTCTCVY
mgnify:CR=1 FL=1